MKILVIKLRYIGDAVLMTPLLKALSQGIEGAEVDVLVNEGAHHMLEGNPYIRRTWVHPTTRGLEAVRGGVPLAMALRRENYDIVADLTANDRSSIFALATGARRRIGFQTMSFFRRRFVYTEMIDAILEDLHNVDYNLLVAERLGAIIGDRHPFIVVNEKARQRVRHSLTAAGVDMDREYLVIHPGARRPYKSWPLESFARLAEDLVREKGMQVVLAGSPSDGPVNRKIQDLVNAELFDLSGQVSLADLPALIEGAQCLVGNDSAPIHIASAVNTPAVAIFGPTDWRLWHPRRESDHVIAAEFLCMPCGHSRSECPLGENYCMSTLPVSQVCQAVAHVIGNRAHDQK